MKHKNAKRTALAAALVLPIALIGTAVYIGTYQNPAHAELKKAGIIEKQVQVGEVTFNYAEGPDNGPPLVLLHAQLLDWFSYSEVLPELSEHFHVYAIDCPGHGKTVYPDDYEMSANNIGASLDQFLHQVIAQPVYLSGNSSGGLLSVWLAAHDPDMVLAVVLEDPPLFSAEYPAIQSTIAYRSFITSEKAVREGYDGDFLLYWVRNSTAFFNNYVFSGAQPAVEGLVKYYRFFRHEGPVEIAFVPPTVREMLRGLDMYDPAFGAAFYNGSWNEGFDHAQALREIQCPVLLIQADTSYMDDGTLNGAMSEEMAMQALDCLAKGEYVKVDATHVTHLDIPEEFSRLLVEFFTGGRIG